MLSWAFTILLHGTVFISPCCSNTAPIHSPCIGHLSYNRQHYATTSTHYPEVLNLLNRQSSRNTTGMGEDTLLLCQCTARIGHIQVQLWCLYNVDILLMRLITQLNSSSLIVICRAGLTLCDFSRLLRLFRVTLYEMNSVTDCKITLFFVSDYMMKSNERLHCNEVMSWR